MKAMKIYILKLYRSSFAGLVNFTENKVRVQSLLKESKGRRDEAWASKSKQILQAFFNELKTIHSENKRLLIPKVLERLYKESIEYGFAKLMFQYCRRRKLELCYDQVHQRYVFRLLRNHFEIWKSQLLNKRGSSNKIKSMARHLRMIEVGI